MPGTVAFSRTVVYGSLAHFHAQQRGVVGEICFGFHCQSSGSAQGEIFDQHVHNFIPEPYESNSFINFLFGDDTWPTAKDIRKKATLSH